ncbi:MAG: 14-3-3 protein [Chaenotheca gracillima]|nr:MAG: 14-3-3 protein [Chaenotheca gracillima]
MAEQASPPSPTSLAPPAEHVEDPGAHELDSSDNDDDHFSSASEGAEFAQQGRSEQASPIPTTRVEKVDDEPSHGEVPGTDAYDMRTQDAVPDEVEVFPDHRPSSTTPQPRSPSISGESAVPTTQVEKLDPEAPSHGDVPGTTAHEKRKADAVPDVVRRVSVSGSDTADFSRSRSGSTPGDLPIPITKVSKVDSSPSHGEVPGTTAFEMRTEDATPDEVEQEAGQHELNASSSASGEAEARRAAEDEDEDGENDGGFGEDFDDFEEGGEDSDFGDFDDGFQEQQEDVAPTVSKEEPLPSIADTSSLPMLKFGDLKDMDELDSALQPYMDELFPMDESTLATPLDPLPAEESIFLSDRSLSLWSQLVATPPLQPPNWVRSRIRRLFLVSLGVPVDLDEILPASKQKKLVLPSIHLTAEHGKSPRPSSDSRSGGGAAKNRPGNNSSTSVNSQGARKRRGPPPVPELDLSRAAMLCATTDAALANLTEEELSIHLETLEEMTRRSSEALEYWLKRKDGAIGDKEAFEGVIENLVKHARKVRK